MDLSSNFVPGNGPEDAKVMIIGEAPGAEEDAQGLPFVGRAGKLLDQTLKEVRLPRSSVYVTNVVPFRPENNATPDHDMIMKFTRKHVIPEYRRIMPRFVLLLGNTALAAGTVHEGGITKHRGWLPHNEHIFYDAVDVYATIHPSAALRSKYNLSLFELDLKVFATIVKCWNTETANP